MRLHLQHQHANVCRNLHFITLLPVH